MRPSEIKKNDSVHQPGRTEERWVRLDSSCAPLPETLLLEHARGRALFIAGAGVSCSAGLPNFRQLVLDVYQAVDPVVWTILKGIPADACNLWESCTETLNDDQRAEVRRFIQRDYDVVLGMLERRIDDDALHETRVRRALLDAIAKPAAGPSGFHKSLVRLASVGSATRLVTTNFDLLLERAAQHLGMRVPCHSLGAVPPASNSGRFAGVLHIHGRMPHSNHEWPDVVITDHDFGQHYLRGRTIADFIFDAARLFNLVLVGYSANDPPMRYLLHAIAADGRRFSDLKSRYAFVGTSDPPNAVELADWRARGITPIPYSSDRGHAALVRTIERWAEFSRLDSDPRRLQREVDKIVSRTYLKTA